MRASRHSATAAIRIPGEPSFATRRDREAAKQEETPMPAPPSARDVLAAVRASPGNRVKLAVSDIDGVLRGKYVHKDKFASAVESGFGFCDVVYGWDLHDQCYDNTTLTGWHKGFPDAIARIDLDTHRNVPWDDGVDFFLASFVRDDGGREVPHPLDPRQVLRRVIARAAKLGLAPMCSLEFEFFNFAETPQSWADKKGVGPEPITPGMFGYSLLRAHHAKDYFRALFAELAAFGVPIEGLHTETGPGVYEAAIVYSDAMTAGDRAILFKSGAKEIAARFGIMPSFMAKWSQTYPGCSGHVHQSLSDGKRNVFFDAKGRAGMSKTFERYLAGQVAVLLEFAPMFWPTINSYKRLVDGFWAPVKPTWGIDNRTASFRVIPGSAKSTRLETRCPGADVNPYLALAACIAAGMHGIEKNLKLATAPIEGTNVGGEGVPRAPRSLAETTRAFRASDTARDWFGDEFVDHFAATREWEWRQWQDAVTDWELKRYFEII
jgi:glutamine synthetase